MNGSAPAERVAELAQPDRLRSELERTFRDLPPFDVVVGLRCGAQGAFIELGRRAMPSEPSRTLIRVGCLAKLFTAMLARRAFEARRLAPDEQVSDLLTAGAARRALRGISVRQLLEHTHGLDDSLLSTMPRDSRGRVDVEALTLELRAAAPLAPPGVLYSYGNAGAWVIAAVLERLGARPYAVQLVEALLEPLSLGVVGALGSICPATGDELALEPRDLLDLIALTAFAAPDIWPDEQRTGDYGFATPLPGWNPLERGVYLGWKYYGAGWLGHQSVWPRQSVLVRTHPRRQLALIVASSDQPAAVVAARIFGAYLPELFELRVPARPNATFGIPTGKFSSCAWRVDIRPLDGAAELRARRSATSDERSAILHAVTPGLWLTRPVQSVFPHVELVELERAYLWNGRFVLPRMAH
jgi:hypothetical protein